MKAIHAIESADDGTDSLGESDEDKSDTDDEPAANSHIAETARGKKERRMKQIRSVPCGTDSTWITPQRVKGRKSEGRLPMRDSGDGRNIEE